MESLKRFILAAEKHCWLRQSNDHKEKRLPPRETEWQGQKMIVTSDPDWVDKLMNLRNEEYQLRNELIDLRGDVTDAVLTADKDPSPVVRMTNNILQRPDEARGIWINEVRDLLDEVLLILTGEAKHPMSGKFEKVITGDTGCNSGGREESTLSLGRNHRAVLTAFWRDENATLKQFEIIAAIEELQDLGFHPKAAVGRGTVGPVVQVLVENEFLLKSDGWELAEKGRDWLAANSSQVRDIERKLNIKQKLNID